MSASGRKAKAIRIQQGHHQHNSHHAPSNELEDVIAKTCGVTVSVKVKPDSVTIRAPDYASYILAKAAIRGRVGAEIIRG